MREILYTVTNNKERIEPRTRQWAGMQFEDNMTNIVFDLSVLGYKNALYRIDFNSPGAGYQPSEALEIINGRVSRALPLSVTQYGGDIQVTAVVTVLDEAGIETGVQLSYPVFVYLTSVNKENGAAVCGNITAAEVSALEAAARAEKAANDAEVYRNETETAAEKTEAAQRALEKDTLFVFNGGDASSEAEVDLVVDDYLSTKSHNPVENAVVARKFEIMNGAFTAEIAEAKEELLQKNEETSQEVETLKKDYVVESYKDGIWNCRKWASGIAECWGIWEGALSDYADYNGFYFYQQQVAFPKGLFVAQPVPAYTATLGEQFCVSGMTLNLSNEQMGCYAMKFGGGESEARFNIRAIGRWK